MSVAVSARQQQQSAGNAHGGSGNNPASRMGTNSPVDNKRLKNEDKSGRSTPAHNHRDLSSKISPPRISHQLSSLSNTTTPSDSIHPPQVAVDQPPDASTSNNNSKNPSDAPSNQQHAQQASRSQQPAQSQANTPGAGDYFTINHNRLDQEPNPFEQSFASNPNDSLITPKAILPPVTAITSPASLIPGSGGSGFNWGINSLRSGPLSPAMLQGPTGTNNVGPGGGLVFDSHIRTGLTPNESGIRSGLTPGGSGSMFPAPSPSGHPTLFQQFVVGGGNGGATPGTMEFHKTALSAARKSQPPPLISSQHQSAKEQDNNPNGPNNHDQHKPREETAPYHYSERNAANGLFLLAQAQAQHQQDQGGVAPSGFQNSPGLVGQRSIENSSPSMAKRAAVNNAAAAAASMGGGGGGVGRSVSGSSMPNSVRGISEMSDDFSDSGAEADAHNSNSSGNRNSRGRNAKGRGSAGRRKAEDQNPGGVGGRGGPSNKKSKGNQGQAMSAGSGSDDGMGMDDENAVDKDGKKMTDEEKRKNFLERNRLAALKCRQRKKQWLANLQSKVELYSSENDNLTAQVASLREEIVALKTLLLAHKDCPVARSNGLNINGLDIAATLAAGGEYGHMMGGGGMGPYGPMGMGGAMGPPGGTRRYS